jgi:hypothetical protein
MKYIKKIDIFGTPINIYYNKNSKYKSKLGGITTLIFTLLSLYKFISIQIEIMQGYDPQIKQNDVSPFPTRIDLSKNFDIAFGMVDGETNMHYTDETLYKIKAE